MKYYSFHIDDSGALEFSDHILINGTKTLVGNIYDDPEFNQLNDILHSTDKFVINDKTLELWKSCNIAEHEIHPALIKRIKRLLGPLGFSMKFKYSQVELLSKNNLNSYKWIDYSKSHILRIENKTSTGNIVQSYNEMQDIWEDNIRSREIIQNIYKDDSLSLKQKEAESDKVDTTYWSTEMITFGKQFNDEIDIFRIPHFSYGTYVSERFKNLMEGNQISDIRFNDRISRLGKPWRKHYPIIHFKMNTYR